MADSEKGDSSTKESKAKTSLLDDDFSKDFLSSWKSISAVGDDMDFNFEPVNKGKKKAFDFGMDMDFSLDDAFGKMSSFKIDMPDLDFSSSPKKITKSKEKPAEDSSKGNHLDKHDKFAFSFDFNGLDDFGLDAPSTKPGKSPSTEKSNKNDVSECEDLPRQVTKDKKEIAEDSISKGPVSAEESKGNHLEKHDNFSISFEFNGLDDFSLDASSTKAGKSPSTEKNNKNDGSECEDLPRQLTKDKKETAEDSISKRPVVCEDAAFSKSEDMVVGDIPSVNWDSKSTVFSYPVQEKETHISSGKKHVEYPHKINHQSYKEGEATSKKSCSLAREGIIGPIPADKTPSSTCLLMPVESADVHMSLGTEETVNCLSVDNEIQQKDEEFSIQSHTQLNKMNCSTKTPLVEASLQINISAEVEISSPERKANDGSAEGSIVAQELPAAVDLTSVAEKLIIDKSPQRSTDKMDINDGNSELGNTDCLGLLDTVDPSVTCGKKVLSSSDRSFSERQNSVLKDSPASIGRGPTAAKRMLIRNEVPGAMNSNFLVSKATNDVSRTELSAYRYTNESSAHIGAADKSNSVSCKSYGHSNHIDKKSDGNPSSCAKKLMKPESVSEKSEKIAAGHNPPRDQEDNRNGNNKNDISISKVPPSGQEAKNGLPSFLCEKMINNVKSSGFKIPSLSPPERGTKAGNQGQGNVKDNISSISSIQKSNIGQGNKLSSQRIEKKMLALPSLKFTRTTTDKQLVTLTKQRNLISPGNFEKSTRLQAVTKRVSPISGEKQTPSTLSLKRKTSEAADVGPAKLHTPKGLSPNASRMCKVSAKELGDGVQTQGDFLEGSRKKVTVDCKTPKFDFGQEANIEALQFSMMVENDENVEKAEACAKELDNIRNMLKKKHEEAKELLVRALVNNNNLLMLNHPIYEEKIRSVQRLASRLLTRELEVNS